MFHNLKTSLGAEPFLGVIVLAISIPLVGIFAFFVLQTALSNPIVIALYAVVLGISLLLGRVAARVGGKLGQRLIRVYRLIFFGGFLVWVFRNSFFPWRGFIQETIFGLLFASSLTLFMLIISEWEEKVERLPDYRER